MTRNLIPITVTPRELAQLLRELAIKVEAGDSLEGFFDYEATSGRLFHVRGVYRTGQSAGQGGSIMLGTPEEAPPDKGGGDGLAVS